MREYICDSDREQRAKVEEELKNQRGGNPWREIKLVPFAEIQPCLDTVWSVEGLLLPGQISVGWGPTGSRKTFGWLDLAQHVAANMEFFDRRVEPGFVVYIRRRSRQEHL
jgi:hypothetical protein